MKNRLFWRLFAAFVGALMLTISVFSFFMVTMVRRERQSAVESEILMQARDIALLLGQQESAFGFFSPEPTLGSAVKQKVLSVRDQYECTVWLVYSNGMAYAIGSDVISSEQLRDENVLEQLYRVLSGEEIQARGLIERYGQDIITVGVPWTDIAARVQGAVMLHLSVATLRVDYSDMIRNACVSAAMALVLGTALSLLIARSQARPLRKINAAVSEFAAGKLDSRVQVRGKGEIAQLADSFNHMAEDLSRLEESRKSFVASVSHELRSPLTSIRGYIEGMQDGTIAPEEQGPYLDVVIRETDRLSGLVNDLLDLSRIESGKVPLQITSFDINELMRLTLIKFERRIDEKNLTVEALLREEPLYASADSSRIVQVLTNLIDNAVKFTPEGGQLAVSAYDTGSQICVSVKNSGPPIAKDDLPFLYDRFFKADRAHTSGMGTGLGLSIVKKILDQHGQSIRCQSGVNGTEFVFTLEAGQPPAPQNPREIESHKDA